MAVDTPEKRFSMLNFGDGTNLHMLFEADGAVDDDDKQHLLDCYSGIAFSVPGGVSPIAMASNSFRFVFNRVFGRMN